MQTDNQQIKDAFAKLPPIVQKTITESLWEEKLRTIIAKLSIHIDDAIEIEERIMAIMVGLYGVNDFADFLEKEVGLSEENIDQLMNYLEAEIFNKIRASLEQKTDVPKNDVTENVAESRDEILKAIEDPEEKVIESIKTTPEINISIPTKPAEPQTTEVTKILPQEVQTPEKTEEKKTNEFDKLTNTVANPSQNIKIDPYREPIE